MISSVICCCRCSPILGVHLVQVLLDVPLGRLHGQQPACLLAGNRLRGGPEQRDEQVLTDERGEQPIECHGKRRQAA